jgi:steroid delta-isomerase-like uncharacterized protein
MDQNLPIAIKKYIEVWTERRIENIDEVLSNKHILHTGADTITDKKLIKQYINERFNTFPDIQYQVTDSIIQGDKYCFLWEARGTHKGVLKAIPPTGKSFYYSGVAIHKLTDDKIGETWIYSNIYEMLERM